MMLFWMIFFSMLLAIRLYYKWAMRRIGRDYEWQKKNIELYKQSRELQLLGLYETAVFVCSREAR